MKEEIFLIVLENLICPIQVYLITEKLKNHLSSASRKGGKVSSKKKKK